MKLDVFIKGELMDLCIPTPEYARNSDWYSWFNNPKTNRFLEQGAFPNTREDEVAFFERERNKRLILIIVDKSGEDIGVISVSSINFEKKIGDMAIVLSEKEHEPLTVLEAVARLTEHAFTKMGLLRMQGGQHPQLAKLRHLIGLIGWKVEGIYEKGFVKGDERVDILRIAALYEDYLKIRNNRGSIWDSNENMIKRYLKMPKDHFDKKLLNFYKEVRDPFYDFLFHL